MAEDNIMLKIENVSKVYRLGEIGGTTLKESLQRTKARIFKKEDPTKKIGAKNYNKGEKFSALDSINLTVKKGERLGIIGHNGAGKSTLLKLICRVTSPSSGEIGLNGRITSMLEVGTGFHPELTGRENIYMNGAILGMTKKEIDDVIESIIDFSEVREFIDTPVKRYSSGMYVKLAFSVAAHLDSEIIIMDEVLAVGDVAFQNKCLKKMKDASELEGRTILYVSHNMDTIRKLCDRVIVLKSGKIIFDGNVLEGISYYIGNGMGNYPNYYNLSGVDRPSNFHGLSIKISELNFIDKVEAIYKQGDNIDLKMQVHSQIDCENLEFLFTISSRTNGVIGSMQTNSAKIKVSKDTDCDIIVSLNTDQLAPDDYDFVIDLFVLNEHGEHLSYDHPSITFNFKIERFKNYKGIYWESNYYGNVILDFVKVLSVK